MNMVMVKTVEKFIEENNMIQEHDTIVAGVSGGADSVCLLLMLIEYRKKVPFTLAVVHVNHKMRLEAGQDANYVRTLCDSLGLPFYLYEEDVETLAKTKGLSTEEAGREVRYKAFLEVRNKLGGKGKIAVAHNENDCAETVLFHLFRGTGLTGLSGILPVRDDIIRPLLCLSRTEIEEYLNNRKIRWCNDSTNQENTYARNKIRNIILPFAEQEICTNSISHIAATAKEVAEVRSYLEAQTKELMKEMVSNLPKEALIPIKPFLSLPTLLQRNLLLSCMEQMTPGRKDITSAHILAIHGLFEKNGQKKVDLPYHLEAVKEYENVRIREKSDKENSFYETEVKVPSKIELPSGKTIEFKLISNEKTQIIPEKTYTKWFDYDKILHCLMLRNRKTGDFLTINQNMDKKKLKDYLIHEKVPKDKRDDMILLTDKEHVLWVLGMRISEYYKVTEQTRQILQVTIK